MAEHTAIAWCDSTFNPWIGCTQVSPGCEGCYAERLMDHRLHRAKWGPGQPRQRTSASNWRQPLLWNREHEAFMLAHGRRRRVFCASMADVFDNEVPVQWRADLLQLIDLTPNLDWLLLTKRIGNVVPMLKDIRRAAGGTFAYDLWPRPNIWLGITVVNQAEADRDIPKLLGVPVNRTFLSFEPLLGRVWLDPLLIAPIEGTSQHGQRFIDWIIVGGESGPTARVMHPAWVRQIRDQCAQHGTPFFFKQWGEWAPRGPESMGYPLVDNVLRIRLTTTGKSGSDLASDGGEHVWMQRVGTVRAGSLLDAVSYQQVPA